LASTTLSLEQEKNPWLAAEALGAAVAAATVGMSAGIKGTLIPLALRAIPGPW
jgi:hypothetical protein